VPLVSFNRVGKRYPDGYEALRDASFAIEAGEFAFLTGHSGAGKTTALKLIPAIERATAGAVLVNGQNVGALREAALPFLRRSLGLVFQDQKLLHDRNVFENAMLPLQICGEPPREAARRVRAALDKVGLAGREKAMPVMLSGGEQQRLCIARAVVNRPGILLADEPTANLDSRHGAEVMQLLRDLVTEDDRAAVVVSHDTRLQAIADRVLLLEDGRLRAG
jgi:cell division transport system ATP-binding protein